MDDRSTLLALEDAFWRAAGDGAAYARNLASDAVHVFPGWGVTDRESAVAGAAGAEPWETFSIESPQFVQLADDVAALVYEAEAARAGRDIYRAAMISVYRRRDGAWELVLHQQTPLSPRSDA